MNKDIWNLFEKIYCINLPVDADRHNFMVDQFNNLDMLSKVDFISAVRPNYKPPNYTFAGEFGCTLSHLKALANSAGSTKPIVVFEDDAEFINNANEFLGELLTNLPDKWSILWLGGRPKQQLTKHSDYIYKIKGFVQTTGYMVNPEHIKPIINFILDNITQPFPDACIDKLLNDYTLADDSGYCMYPPIVSQIPGYSTLRLANRDYTSDTLADWSNYI